MSSHSVIDFLTGPNGETECMEPGCRRSIEIRGLCSGHYSKYKWRVQNGNTTWDKLEQDGLVAKTRNRKLNLALGCYQRAETSDISLRFGGDKALVEKHLMELRAKYEAEGLVNA